MKLLTFTLALTASLSLYAQKRITFDYDNSGNQIERTICVNCGARLANDSIRANQEVEKVQKEFKDNGISYFPNPVMEQLTIRWVNSEDIFIDRLEIISMSGQLVNVYSNLKNNESQLVDFRTVAQGIYNVILWQNNGKKKTVKIVKR